MQFDTPLIRGTLLRRYKRFLADVTLEDGREVTVHCANPGAMLGLKEPGMRVWVEPNDNPARKLKFTWRLVELPDDHWAGIDTSVPNKVVGDALRRGMIPDLAAYDTIRAEVKYGQNSRVDFLATGSGLQDAFVEVKNVHLRREGTHAEFPDSVTTRGAKHLRELSDMVADGHRAVMFYLVQRTDCTAFRLAPDLDPGYAQAFTQARKAGVEVICYDTDIHVEGISLRSALPLDMP